MFIATTWERRLSTGAMQRREDGGRREVDGFLRLQWGRFDLAEPGARSSLRTRAFVPHLVRARHR